VYLLIRRMTSNRIALMASILCAVNPMFLYFARKARAYSLVIATSTLAFLLLYRAIDRDRRIDWFAFATILIVLAYLQILTVLFVPTYALILASQKPTMRSWRRLGLSIFGVVAACIPLAQIVAHNDASDLAHLVRPNVAMLFGAISKFGGSLWGALVGVFLIGYGVSARAQKHRDASTVWLLTLCFLLPILTLWVVSQVRPIFEARYCVFAFVPFIALCAIGIDALGLRTFCWGALLAVAVFAFFPIRTFYLDGQEDWRSAATLLASAHASADEIAFPMEHLSVAESFYEDRYRPQPNADGRHRWYGNTPFWLPEATKDTVDHLRYLRPSESGWFVYWDVREKPDVGLSVLEKRIADMGLSCRRLVHFRSLALIELRHAPSVSPALVRYAYPAWYSKIDRLLKLPHRKTAYATLLNCPFEQDFDRPEPAPWTR
jgi:Dolichyl-phosphate-mannose-protein mannosyltransferase